MKFRLTVSEVLVFMALAAVCLYGVSLAVRQQQFATERSLVHSKQFGILYALEYYAAEHGHLPPLATIPEDDGEGLSWRVLILPYFGVDSYKALHQKFDLSKSWDSPENLNLVEEMPIVFAMTDGVPGEGKTTCLAVTVSGEWNGGDGINADGATILMVEVSSGAEWSRPVDLDLSKEHGHILPFVSVAMGMSRSPIAISRNRRQVNLPVGVKWATIARPAESP
jgi:hypothetical protein